MTRRPTKAHHELLKYINAFTAENGYSPSFDDILENTPLKSKGHITVLLNKLENEGLLERQRRQARSMLVTKQAQGVRSIPVIGPIAAGQPIHLPATPDDLDENVERLDIAASSMPHLPATRPVYALRVQGDSMIDAAILDGDIVILERPQSNAQITKNKLVAAWLVNEGETTLKRYVPQADGSVWLVPENPDREQYKPLVIKNPEQDLEIHGIFVGLLRNR